MIKTVKRRGRFNIWGQAMLKKIITKYIAILAFAMFISTGHAQLECTSGYLLIERLHVHITGWVHVELEGLGNADLNSCGTNSSTSLLLNYNDTTGTADGRTMMYSTILAAFNTGKKVKICSSGCDTQHPTYSRIYQVDVE